MSKFTYFSRHAFLRVDQRTALRYEDVANLLDRQLFIDTGHVPGFNRRHLLFYSEPDQACFVAVQDAHSGTVVTVLPLDYHETLAWKITDEDQQRAKELYLRRPPVERKLQPKDLAASKFIISLVYLDRDRRYPRVRQALSLPSCGYQGDLRRLLRDESWYPLLDQKAAQHAIDPRDVLQLRITLGHGGAPVYIDMR